MYSDVDYKREVRRNLRKATLEILGAKCKLCGFSDARALQIDHVNGDGATEKLLRKSVHKYSRLVIASVLAEENRYQLLCANCNWIKRSENKEWN